MKTRQSFLLVFLLFTISCYSQDHPKHYRQLHFYLYGLQAYSYDGRCETLLQKQFGFDYQTKAGCVVRTFQVWRYDHHNDRIERKLDRRHGGDWHKKYDEELASCEAGTKK